jgi:predicted DNA-binding protein with PD1-like motif
MRSKLLNNGAEKTYALIFDAGDEVVSLLKRFATDHKPRSARFTAIGAFSDAVLAYFDWDAKEYKKNPVPEQVEVLTLAGDIAWKPDGTPGVHAHVVVGKSDGTTRGGHLMEAHVRPTLELILTEYPRFLEKTNDPESGLALIRL